MQIESDQEILEVTAFADMHSHDEIAHVLDIAFSSDGDDGDMILRDIEHYSRQAMDPEVPYNVDIADPPLTNSSLPRTSTPTGPRRSRAGPGDTYRVP